MPEMTEEKIFEAFDLEAPKADTNEEPKAEEGGKEQELAEPETETPPEEEERRDEGAPEGEKEQEIAEPAKEPEQTEQERREQAAQRRRRERQEAIDRAVQDAVKAERDKTAEELKSFFEAAGLKDTMTGKPITSMEEFRAWRQAFNAAKLENELKEGKLTPEGLNQAISENPIVKQAAEAIRASEEAKRQSGMEAAKARAERELAEIRKMDPEAKLESVEDLLKMPNAKEFYEYVKRGNSFVDAYKLANFQRLSERTAEAAKQQALNNARSKDHLSGSGASRGSGSESVPAEEMAMFRLMMPDASDDEIRKYYNKYKT